MAKPPADDPYIAGVRVGQYQPRVVRLVFDLKQGVAPQVFTLAPVAAYQHRLVLDLYAAQPKDPLAELIAEREANAQQAVGDVNDALGDWLQRREAERAQAPVSASQPAPPPAPQPPAPKPPAAPTPASGKVARLRLIALDPGHGGEDPGAIGPSGLREKDVVLAIAPQLRERLL